MHRILHATKDGENDEFDEQDARKEFAQMDKAIKEDGKVMLCLDCFANI